MCTLIVSCNMYFVHPYFVCTCTNSMSFLHSPLSDMITGSSCHASKVSLYNCSMKVIVRRPLDRLPCVGSQRRSCETTPSVHSDICFHLVLPENLRHFDWILKSRQIVAQLCTVNSLVLVTNLCAHKSGRLREVIAYWKNQQHKPKTESIN